MDRDKKYDLCIIGGCGHVGLPLGLAFADRGQRVVLYDINQDAVDKINKKMLPFLEEGAPEILTKVVNSKLLVATTDMSVISQAPNLILVIGTPVDEHLNPRLHDVMGTIQQVLEYLRDDQLIVLRSTLYPGVTDRIYDYLRSQGKQTSVAFCPERIAEGHALKEFSSLPQIVSGCDPTSLNRAKDLFSTLSKEIVELLPIEAELAKLFTNTWRYINFAISNQFYMIANSYGLDFYKIYDGMVEKYPRLQGFAKAGFAAGPCLFKDTMQLSAFSNNNFFMGHAAMLVNEGLPNYIVEQLKLKVVLKEKTIGILGMAFKANNDDPRESLSYKLKKILELEAAKVVCSDVYISAPDFIKSEELVEQSDVIILATPHREYKAIDLKDKPVVDIWNFFGKGGRTL
ncbi:MAG: nucleotide sugar dehydrogenase [Candidatus Vogelbacteria bacterium]|nr:nucleotide sugar dehydrogenase [Candidatus Vogelbacteria bacterium]